jgi:hypothetical protein
MLEVSDKDHDSPDVHKLDCVYDFALA